MYVLEMIKVSLISTHSLLDDLPSSIIEHPLMTCLRHSLRLILEHLMAIYYSVSATERSMSLRLVNVIAALVISLLNELATR